MTRSQTIPWLRIGTEAAAIVASILLAFAIDAWWQQRSEDKQAAALVESLYTEFQSSQAHIERWLAGNTKILRATSELLAELESAGNGETISVPLELILGSVGAPTYSPTDSALLAAASSGHIELIESAELRNVLALWQQQRDDTREDELLIREIVVHHLVPALSKQVRLGGAFDFEYLTGWFLEEIDMDLSDPVELRAETELEGALAERVFYTTFVVEGLASIRQTQARILELLEESRRNE